MKTARNLFAIMACGSLVLGRGYAIEPSARLGEEDAHKSHAASAHAAKGAQENGRAPEKSSKNAKNNLRQRATKMAPTVIVASKVSKIESHPEQLGKLPVGSGTTAPRPGVVQRRDTTVAALNGAKASGAKHTAAAVDGAAVKPKP